MGRLFRAAGRVLRRDEGPAPTEPTPGPSPRVELYQLAEQRLLAGLRRGDNVLAIRSAEVLPLLRDAPDLRRKLAEGPASPAVANVLWPWAPRQGAIYDAFDSPEATARRAMAEQLKPPRERDVPGLLGMLESGDPHPRVEAAHALRGIEGITGDLFHALKKAVKEPWVFGAIAATLARQRDAMDVMLGVRPVLDDFYATLRDQVARAEVAEALCTFPDFRADFVARQDLGFWGEAVRLKQLAAELSAEQRLPILLGRVRGTHPVAAYAALLTAIALREQNPAQAAQMGGVASP